MSKFSLTFSLMKSSWELLKKDKEILIFPLLSGICCILVFISFAFPLINSPEMRAVIEGKQEMNYGKYYLLMFLFYFFNYFIIIFFNSAVVAAADIRLKGGNPTVKDGLNASLAILPLIIVWSLVASTVGLILRAIEERSNTFGRIMAGLLGLAWSVVSFLVIPILVVEKKGPFAALKESTSLMKKTWGEQLIGRFSFGLVFVVLGIPAYLLIILGIATQSVAAIVVFATLSIIYLVILALVQSALQSIFQTVVYNYSHDQKVSTGFNEQTLASAFGPKKKTGIAGIFNKS